MNEWIRTNPWKHYSTTPFPSNNKILRADLESQPFPKQDEWPKSQPHSAGDSPLSPLSCTAVLRDPSHHSCLCRRGSGELAPCFGRKGFSTGMTKAARK